MNQENDLPVSVVIPLYNESAIIDKNLNEIAGFLNRLLGRGNWLFILVENGSTDSTPQLVDAAVARWPQSRAIHLREPNYGAALKAGLLSATTKWVYLLDIEQWDFPFMAWAWSERRNYDCFIASKRADPFINEQQYYRRILSCGLNAMLQLFLQFTGTDTHGPKLIHHAALGPLAGLCQLDRGQFDTELVLRAVRSQKKIVEAPVEYRELRKNRNWMIKKIIWNILAFRRLTHVMKNVPIDGYARYYRFPREEVLSRGNAQLARSEELGVV